MFRYCDSVRTRRVHHHDAFAGRSVGIDVVHANSCTTDHPQSLRRVDQLRIYVRRGADNERIGIAHCGREVAHLLGGNHVKVWLVAKYLKCGW